MHEIKESMSVADRVASFVVAAALVVTIGVIAIVGPNTALSAASVATSQSPFEIHHPAVQIRHEIRSEKLREGYGRGSNASK